MNNKTKVKLRYSYGIAFMVVVAATCYMPDVASAAIETVYGSFAPVTTPYENQAIEIQQFDPSLGTLESVTIKADGPGYFTYWFRMVLSGAHPFGPSTDQPHSNSKHPWSATYFTGISDGVQNNAKTTVKHSGKSASLILTSSSDLLLFEGTGFTSFYLSSFRSTRTLAGVNFTISYNYNAFSAVPEPSTWLTGVFAASSLLFFFRRNQL